MTGFLWMVSLLGIIDVLGHVTKLSVFVQIVNSLPWEQIEAMEHMLDTTARLRDQLTKAELTESDFPTLQPVIPELLTGHLHGVKLHFTGCNTTDPKAALTKTFKRLLSWLEKFDSGMRTRLLNDIPLAFKHMAKCLDLRRLARAELHSDDVEQPALCWLADWIRTEGRLSLPDSDILWQQHLTVRTRLVARAGELKGTRSEWFPEDRTLSGTVMMKELFTSEALYKDVPDWMYLFELCVTHTSNEAVVESMGNVIDKHASPTRGLLPENYAREAFIHWNGPPLLRADKLLVAALNHHFAGDGPQDWNFVNKVQRGDKLKFKHVSKVIDRVRSQPSRLPFMEEPTSTAPVPVEVTGVEGGDATGILQDCGADAPDGPTHEEQGTWAVEEVRKYRFNKRTRRDEWHIKWKGWGERHNTWEPLANLTCPSIKETAISLKRAAGHTHIIDDDSSSTHSSD